MYFVPMKSGLFKMFGVPDSSYFCCNGSGIESFSKLGNNIYYEAGGTLYVNLFIASTATWRSENVRVVQETRFPEQDWTVLTFKLPKPRAFTLKLRIPSWEVKAASARINGSSVAMDIRSDGYLTISRTWREGDKVRLSFPMRLSISHFVDDRTVGAIMYGPIVLAGALGSESMTKEMENGLGWEPVDRMFSQGAAVKTPTLVIPNADPNLWIEPVKGKPLTFRTVGVGKPHDVKLIPFYKMFGQRYAVYWNMYAPYEWQSLQASRQATVPGVIDRVVVGNHRSERDHNFQSFRFQRGERMGEPWVKSTLSVRYDLDVDTNKGNILQCRFWRGEGTNAFELLIDGVSVAKDSLSRGGETPFVDVTCPVPPELLRGKHRVSVMVKNRSGKSTPELYGCAILRRGD
jgi:uncharacterized protein